MVVTALLLTRVGDLAALAAAHAIPDIVALRLGLR